MFIKYFVLSRVFSQQKLSHKVYWLCSLCSLRCCLCIKQLFKGFVSYRAELYSCHNKLLVCSHVPNHVVASGYSPPFVLDVHIMKHVSTKKCVVFEASNTPIQCLQDEQLFNISLGPFYEWIRRSLQKHNVLFTFVSWLVDQVEWCGST